MNGIDDSKNHKWVTLFIWWMPVIIGPRMMFCTNVEGCFSDHSILVRVIVSWGSLAKFWDIITISSIEWIKISIKDITTQLIIMSLSPPEASYKLLWTNVQYRFSYIYWLLGRLQILSSADLTLAFLLASNHYHNFLSLSFCVMLVCRSNGMVKAFFLCYMFRVIIVIVANVAVVSDMFAPHEKLWQWVWGPSQ